MVSFVHVTISHLQAWMGENKAFRNSYWCGVLKHSKIRAWILAGQWKKILTTSTSRLKKTGVCAGSELQLQLKSFSN